MRKYILLFVIILALNSCESQNKKGDSQSSIYLEGEWKIKDWTIDKHLGESEIEFINNAILGATIGFSEDHIFSSSAPEVFKHFENRKFEN